MTRPAGSIATTLAAAACLAGCAGAPAPSPAAQPAAPASPTAPAATVPESCIVAGASAAGAAPGSLPATLAVAEGGASPRLTGGFGAGADLVRARRGLVRIDCGGAPRPDLASTWASDAELRVWTFALTDARDSAGAPVTSASILAAWLRRAVGPGATGRAEPIAAWAPDGKHLVVSFPRSAPDAPLLLADPRLAISTDSADEASFRLVASDGDARDLIDRGIDFVVTRDPAALGYAAGRGLETRALPWDRTYMLVAPALASDSSGVAASLLGAGMRDSLAAFAVRAEARGAMPPFWWTGPSGCHAPATSPARRRARLAYLQGDPVARALAERIVALAGAGRSLPGALRTALAPPLVAVGMSDAELRSSIVTGAEAGYVVALPRLPRLDCAVVPPWPAGATAVALIDTRAHLVVRDGAPPVAIDGDGTVRPLRSNAP